MTNDLLALAGWYFLPRVLSGYLQTALYAIFIRAGDPKPALGTARFVRDRKRLWIFVIIAYLCYTVYEVDYQLRREGDFYSSLGVTHDVDERALQSRFRRLTVQYHPDKASGPDKAAIEAIYIQLKVARDTLIDPAKRFAYDRFGADILQWRQCKTIKDFVFAGVQRMTSYYVGCGSVLVLFSVLSYLQQGRYWRYLVMASLFAIEVHTMMRPDFPEILIKVVNPLLLATKVRTPYLPFQMLALLRKLTITFYIALSQLGLVLQGSQGAGPAGDGVSAQQLDRVDALAKATDQEINRLVGLELMPFAGDQASTRDLRTSLKKWLVQNTIRSDAEVKGAIGRVLDRRRQGGLPGQETFGKPTHHRGPHYVTLQTPSTDLFDLFPTYHSVSSGFSIISEGSQKDLQLAEKGTIMDSLTGSATTTFRFLDLAPELRNSIYSYVFEDTAPTEINLLTAQAHLPPYAIVLVSRQLYEESAGILLQTTQQFWNCHLFYIFFTCMSWHLDFAKKHADLVARCRKIPARGLRRLEFRFDMRSPITRRIHHALLMEDDGTVTQKVWFVYAPLGRSLCNALLEATADYLEFIPRLAAEKGISLAVAGPVAGLDVVGCVAVECDEARRLSIVA
ncbi:hypothetical protein LTR36_010390 [Oleoguttula mirabilis]|uniref:J domain-containing protein n=1 Tax=Oleoguttula mirabilis TaxID=1507867 RepID=A0AAV9J495_9PEZI|nr:hypothetical protein LTR36_010390 [Oleoguttula mirabilis]